MLVDIEKNTVDFMPNYDDRLQEPTVLPAKIPALLINGSSGIAVGMATNIPPHNLTEVINAIIKIIDDDNVSDEDLMQIIKGPDFPTGGVILGREGIKQAYTTGRGKISVRAEAEIEEMSGNKQRIIVRSLPYQVNKAKLIENGAEIEESTKFEELPNIISESNLGNSKWKRPKKWLDMPNIIVEESKYIPLMITQPQEQLPQSLDTNTFSNSFKRFLSMTESANLSEITTHVDGNNFYVSANDMAYVMLCDVSKNSNDNIITFEGMNLAGYFPFTDINMAYTDNNKTPFLSDLFIQIDDETPLNLSELSRGNITLPTSGKYKNISIIDREYSCNVITPQSTDNIEVMEASSNSLVEHAINTNASEYNAPLISFMIKLDYGDFSDNTLIDNKKQCVYLYF